MVTEASDARQADPAHEVASQWRLMWWRFRRHKLAVGAFLIVLLLYLVALFAEFLTPVEPRETNRDAVYHPPQMVHFIDWSDGGWRFAPHVYKQDRKRDPRTLRTTFAPTDEKVYLTFFAPSAPYRLWDMFTFETRLLGAADPAERVYFVGADRLGRDVLSRTIHGTRISMSIGLVGVIISLVLGVVLGGLSGYYGGRVDMVIQRLVEFVLSLPTIPIWLALAAAIPPQWPPHMTFFAITIIISLIGWTELARVVRGRFLSLRTEDFVVAARLDGASERRVIFRHMLPSMTSHVIASTTLAIPAMIIAETSLSFLGLGIQPPAISWGALLQEAQNLRSITQGPWLFFPGLAVVLAVLSLNFMGDGLRDAADPYAQGGQ